jgi:tetratricopeptide (TPR) repeat protein
MTRQRCKAPGRGRWLIPSVAALVVAAAAPARAQDADELARRHFESGAAYLQESDYESALKAFRKSYELSKRPEIQLNIATVHERMGNLQGAVDALEKYLVDAPQGEHVETVKIRIANLKKHIAEQPPGSAAATEPASAPQQTTAQPAPMPVAAPPPSAEREPPNRIPAYVLLSVGGLAAGGAVITGVFAQSEYNDAEETCAKTQAGCSDDEVSSGRTMALSSTILTGVAIVGVGVGVALWLTADSGSERPTSGAPRVNLALRPGGAAAAASWRF